MFGVTTSDDYRPVAWIGRYPLRVTSIFCGLLVLGMFVTVISETAGWNYLALAFNARDFLHGRVWQPLTAPLIQQANFFFLLNVLFFYWSGNQVEQYLGVRRYLCLIGLLLIVPPIFLILWSAAGVNPIWLGSYELSVGMFIAFATLYPNLELFGWVTLKWFAFAGLVIGSLSFLPRHEWGPLTILWGMCLVAFGFIRQIQGHVSVAWPKLNPFRRRKPRLHVVQRSSSRVVEPDDVYSSIDPILDKISKSGIGSLTDGERRQLDRARNRLLKKSE